MFELKKFLAKIKRLFSVAYKSLAVYLASDEKYEWNDSRLNRKLLMIFGFLFIFDYMMFCYHSDKNIFDIFPSLPAISQQHEVTVYLPGLDGSLFEESRLAPDFDGREHFIRFLFDAVVKGSRFQNTALAVPAQMNIRKIWMEEEGPGLCAIDCEITGLSASTEPLPDSEELFIRALTETIKANIPDVSDVLVLNGGIRRRLW